jgi:hypothetical protein
MIEIIIAVPGQRVVCTTIALCESDDDKEFAMTDDNMPHEV